MLTILKNLLLLLQYPNTTFVVHLLDIVQKTSGLTCVLTYSRNWFIFPVRFLLAPNIRGWAYSRLRPAPFPLKNSAATALVVVVVFLLCRYPRMIRSKGCRVKTTLSTSSLPVNAAVTLRMLSKSPDTQRELFCGGEVVAVVLLPHGQP